jgi:transcriptional regulator with XRE-family HTH domain
MPAALKFGSTAPAAVHVQAQLLGVRLRVARKRRRLTLRELAAKAGIAYDTARAVENGSIQTGIGAYLAHAWAMGLDHKFTDLLKPEDDAEGSALEIANLSKRVRHPSSTRDNDF